MEDALPLRDIHLPPEPAFWPLAPGWWWTVAALIGAALLLFAAFRWLLPLLKAKRRARQRQMIWRVEVDGIADPRLRLQAAIEVARRFALSDGHRIAESAGIDRIAKSGATIQPQTEADADLPGLRSLPYQKQPPEAEVLPLIERLRVLALQGARR